MNAAALRMMLEKGLSLADAVDIAEAYEEGCAKPLSMSPSAVRMRAKRDRDTSQTAVTCDASHDALSPDKEKSPRTPLKEINPQTPVVVVGESAGANDWPEGNAPQLAELLIAEANSPWLDPHKSLGLPTTVGRIAAWKRDGASWGREVVPIVVALSRARSSAIGTWKFFDNAIAQAIANNRSALRIPDERDSQIPGSVARRQGAGSYRPGSPSMAGILARRRGGASD